MIPKTGECYTTNKSILGIKVWKVHYISDKGYIKLTCCLFNKNNGIIYEERKKYKLDLENIKHWIKYEEKYFY